MSKPLTIALCAGEASGDLLGAHLIEAIKARRSDTKFIGIGGTRMTAAGCQSLFDQERLAVRGYTEVLKRLPEILKIRRQLIAQLKQIRPDVFVGIDAPDFNLGVEEALKAAGIPTVHYVSPSVWAWKRERVNKIVRQANQVLCLFPMEPPLYQAAGGHLLRQVLFVELADADDPLLSVHAVLRGEEAWGDGQQLLLDLQVIGLSSVLLIELFEALDLTDSGLTHLE